jgi:hypothetical protein
MEARYCASGGWGHADMLMLVHTSRVRLAVSVQSLVAYSGSW